MRFRRRLLRASRLAGSALVYEVTSIVHRPVPARLPYRVTLPSTTFAKNSGPRSGTASPSCQTVPFVPNGILYQGSAPAHESRSRRIRSPLAAIRAWEFYERGNAPSLTRRSWRFRRGLAARPRLGFVLRKGSLCVLIRERIILWA